MEKSGGCSERPEQLILSQKKKKKYVTYVYKYVIPKMKYI